MNTRAAAFTLIAVAATGCMVTPPEQEPQPLPQPPAWSGPSCGDNVCSVGESCSSCPLDCGECPPPPPPPPVCSETEIAGSLPLDDAETTTGAPAAADTLSCGDGATGPMQTYRWTAPAGGNYQISATGGFAIVLGVRQGDCNGHQLACSAAPAGPTTTVALSEGEWIAIEVAGQAGASGTFNLNITRLPDACGDGVCELGEDANTCASDCGTSGPNDSGGSGSNGGSGIDTGGGGIGTGGGSDDGGIGTGGGSDDGGIGTGGGSDDGGIGTGGGSDDGGMDTGSGDDDGSDWGDDSGSDDGSDWGDDGSDDGSDDGGDDSGDDTWSRAPHHHAHVQTAPAAR